MNSDEAKALFEALVQSQQQAAATQQQMANAVASMTAVRQDRDSQTKDLPKPKDFGSEDREKDRRAWPEWSFKFEGWLAAGDIGYRAELGMAKQATTPLEMFDMADGTAQRSIRMYGLLQNLMTGRCHCIVKAIKDNNSPQGPTRPT